MMIMNFFTKHLALASLSMLALTGMASAATITVTEPFSRATAPTAKTGAAFMTLGLDQGDDKLLSVSSPVAEKVELHTHIMENGVAQMRAVDAIPLAAGTPVELKPGGLHVMLIGLKAPLKAGDMVPLTLRFEKAGEVAVSVPVKGPGARPAPAAGEQGGHSGHQH
jgi:copper(I)-binding protein